jgi:hypothetical protein
MPFTLRPALVLAACALALSTAACGRADRSTHGGSTGPAVGVKGDEQTAAQDLGFPGFATKNTVRVGGADPTADAVAAAHAVFPVPPGAGATAASRSARPTAVALVDAADWRAALAASVLVAQPLGAPVLFSTPKDVPAATGQAIEDLAPTGATAAKGAQVIRVGNVANPAGVRTVDIPGSDPFTLARSIDAFSATARGQTSDRVIVVGSEDPAFAMPAAAWAAKSGDPILFVTRNAVPQPTADALKAHAQPKIYVVGPPSAVSEPVVRRLETFGKVTRVSGPDVTSNAIAFARFRAGTFGWGITDPGHGFVFAAAGRPTDAAAAAPLSASGSYGPLLVLPGPPAVATLPAPVRDFLLDVQPGYTDDPVRGVYNRGWIVGDEKAISLPVQSQIDQLLEIVPVNR